VLTANKQHHDPAHPEEFSIRLIDWSFLTLGNTMTDEEDEEADRADEPPVVCETS
jgi:hypothetical protein